MERLRAATPREQTFSAGVAQWDGTETPEQLLARADAALYEAKHSGRDRVVAPSPPAAVTSYRTTTGAWSLQRSA